MTPVLVAFIHTDGERLRNTIPDPNKQKSCPKTNPRTTSIKLLFTEISDACVATNGQKRPKTVAHVITSHTQPSGISGMMHVVYQPVRLLKASI